MSVSEAKCRPEVSSVVGRSIDREIREAYVLGKMLYYVEDYEVAKNQVSVEDFSGLHRLLLPMICNLYAKGEEPSFDNLVEMCEESGVEDIDEVCRWVTRLLVCADDPRGVQYYVDKLKHGSPLPLSPQAETGSYLSACQDGNIYTYYGRRPRRPLSRSERGTAV